MFFFSLLDRIGSRTMSGILVVMSRQEGGKARWVLDGRVGNKCVGRMGGWSVYFSYIIKFESTLFAFQFSGLDLDVNLAALLLMFCFSYPTKTVKLRK